jgi:hypothetical protein
LTKAGLPIPPELQLKTRGRPPATRRTQNDLLNKILNTNVEYSQTVQNKAIQELGSDLANVYRQQLLNTIVNLDPSTSHWLDEGFSIQELEDIRTELLTTHHRQLNEFIDQTLRSKLLEAQSSETTAQRHRDIQYDMAKTEAERRTPKPKPKPTLPPISRGERPQINTLLNKILGTNINYNADTQDAYLQTFGYNGDRSRVVFLYELYTERLYNLITQLDPTIDSFELAESTPEVMEEMLDNILDAKYMGDRSYNSITDFIKRRHQTEDDKLFELATARHRKIHYDPDKAYRIKTPTNEIIDYIRTANEMRSRRDVQITDFFMNQQPYDEEAYNQLLRETRYDYPIWDDGLNNEPVRTIYTVLQQSRIVRDHLQPHASSL